jgi:hypothetical protein
MPAKLALDEELHKAAVRARMPQTTDVTLMGKKMPRIKVPEVIGNPTGLSGRPSTYYLALAGEDPEILVPRGPQATKDIQLEKGKKVTLPIRAEKGQAVMIGRASEVTVNVRDIPEADRARKFKKGAKSSKGSQKALAVLGRPLDAPQALRTYGNIVNKGDSKIASKLGKKVARQTATKVGGRAILGLAAADELLIQKDYGGAIAEGVDLLMFSNPASAAVQVAAMIAFGVYGATLMATGNEEGVDYLGVGLFGGFERAASGN